MTNQFKVGDLVVYIPKSGEIIKSHISRILKIQNGYIYLKFYDEIHRILPESIHHYPLQNINKNTFEIEI
jgi:hypothetical protein